MQPIVVREMPEDMRQRLNTEARLEIVAGERRWRAANIAGLPTVPVLLRDLTDEQVISLQIIEKPAARRLERYRGSRGLRSPAQARYERRPDCGLGQ
jgi:ParB/RepB/Spo0J family partition protein